jgi:uncharacterized membrane protein
MSTFLTVAILCLLPISELRGGLPYALARGWAPAAAVPVCVLLNCLAAPVTYGFVSTVHRFLVRFKPYERVFDRLINRARRKVAPQVARFGAWGLVVFVGVPLPFTGAYTGAMGAWVLGMSFRRAILPVCAGVLLAAAIVTAVYYLVTIGGVEALRVFIKG